MNKPSRRRHVSWILALLLVLGSLSLVQAGNASDYGTLDGTPATANYVAWLTKAGTPPSQIITEDSVSSPSGTDQGYDGAFWILEAGADFDSPAVAQGDQVQMLFGGTGSAAGTIWQTSFLMDLIETDTNQGNVMSSDTGSCPSMQVGSVVDDQKLIRWSATVDNYYLVYRAIMPSGAGNGASNGVYAYVATVQAAGSVAEYTDTVAGDTWHLVVPADANGNIIGCHSEESTPNSVVVRQFRAAFGDAGMTMTLAGVGLLGIIGLGAAALRRGRTLRGRSVR